MVKAGTTPRMSILHPFCKTNKIQITTWILEKDNLQMSLLINNWVSQPIFKTLIHLDFRWQATPHQEAEAPSREMEGSSLLNLTIGYIKVNPKIIPMQPTSLNINLRKIFTIPVEDKDKIWIFQQFRGLARMELPFKTKQGEIRKINSLLLSLNGCLRTSSQIRLRDLKAFKICLRVTNNSSKLSEVAAVTCIKMLTFTTSQLVT